MVGVLLLRQHEEAVAADSHKANARTSRAFRPRRAQNHLPDGRAHHSSKRLNRGFWTKASRTRPVSCRVIDDDARLQASRASPSYMNVNGLGPRVYPVRRSIILNPALPMRSAMG